MKILKNKFLLNENGSFKKCILNTKNVANMGNAKGMGYAARLKVWVLSDNKCFFYATK